MQGINTNYSESWQMKSLVTAATIAITVLVVGSARAQVAPSADPVLYWNDIAMQQISLDEPDPGQAGRSYAMLNIAMHDAVNATLGAPDHSYVQGVAASGGDTRVAAAYAAHDVLVSLDPGGKAAFDAALAASLGGVSSTKGMATGQSYASAVLALRANDGYSSPPPPYLSTGAPGNYVPTIFQPDGTPVVVGQQYATAKPFVIASDSQFRVGSPYPLNSAAYAADYNQVKSLGALNSTSRTADQTQSALFWAANPETPYLSAAISDSVATGKSTLDNARDFATLTAAVADATPVIMDSKFAYDFWRPITAIHEGGLDGNALTAADPDWQSLLAAPPFPSYFSGHATVAGTAAAVLDEEFGSGSAFCFTNSVAERCWKNFDQAAQDDANSRLWGGIHFNADNQLGLAVGQEIGEYVLDSGLFAPAAPEPTSWALMIFGIGVLGAVLRRRPAENAFRLS